MRIYDIHNVTDFLNVFLLKLVLFVVLNGQIIGH